MSQLTKVDYRIPVLIFGTIFILCSIATGDQGIELVGHSGGGNYGVTIIGTTLYIGVGPRLFLYDISTPSDPVLLGQSDPLPEIVYGIAIEGNTAYVANAAAGIRILNILDPGSIEEVGYFDAYFTYDVAVSGDLAYLATTSDGMIVVNIANPSAPKEVGAWNTPGYAYALTLWGNYVYVADMMGGVRIIDISNPSAPDEVGDYNSPDYSRDVTISGNFAYIADTYSGLRILDITDPENPFEDSFLQYHW